MEAEEGRGSIGNSSTVLFLLLSFCLSVLDPPPHQSRSTLFNSLPFSQSRNENNEACKGERWKECWWSVQRRKEKTHKYSRTFSESESWGKEFFKPATSTWVEIFHHNRSNNERPIHIWSITSILAKKKSLLFFFFVRLWQRYQRRHDLQKSYLPHLHCVSLFRPLSRVNWSLNDSWPRHAGDILNPGRYVFAINIWSRI